MNNHKTKIIAGSIALFALAVIFVGFYAVTQKAQAQACAPNCYPPVSGYCTVDRSQANIGETVTFSGWGQGGNNLYVYSWTGDEGLTGQTRVISKAYSTPGTKRAIVRITSNGQSVYKTCTVVIRESTPPPPPPCTTNCYPPVSGYCTVDRSQANIGETVTFSVFGQGGNNLFVYSWSGDDGLSAQTRTVSHVYSTSGTKNATVRITSNGQSVYKTCSTYIRPAVIPIDLNVFCTASPSEANIGETVTYTSHVSGGNPASDPRYLYSWTGTDGLTSTNANVSKSYSTSGTKTATVTVTAGDQTRSATCSAVIRRAPVDNDLGGYCEGRPSTVDVDERVTWTAYPTGGNGSYDYDWSGDDGLDGNSKSITHRYSNTGTKEARVQITSDGQSVTKTCEIRVRDDNNDNDLDAYCVANPNSANINERVTYTVYPSGSNSSNYRYSWSGTDGLDGSSKSVSHSYSSPGNKTAKVKVTLRDSNDNNDDEVTATCYSNVVGNILPPIYTPPQYTPPQYIPPQQGVYLDTIPATGLSPTVKSSLFLAGTLIWSAFIGYIFLRRRNLILQEQRMIDDAMNS